MRTAHEQDSSSSGAESQSYMQSHLLLVTCRTATIVTILHFAKEPEGIEFHWITVAEF